uniref:Hypothetical secreted peptide n=1 Tax=Glossina morsitans morsitans TaxID=37546 RepID=D3TST5_GLOMM
MLIVPFLSLISLFLLLKCLKNLINYCEMGSTHFVFFHNLYNIQKEASETLLEQREILS